MRACGQKLVKFCTLTHASKLVVELRRDFRSCSNRQLMVGYNHSFRYIMNYHRNCSASGMFVFNNTIRTCVQNLGGIRRPVRKNCLSS